MSSFVFVALATLIFASVQGSDYGMAVLYGGSADPGIVGYVYFVPLNSSFVRVYANISGITQNLGTQHGMHVHTFGDVLNPTIASAGGHFIGSGTGIHGCFPNASRDEGDMGNWDVSSDGKVLQSKDLDLLILQGDNSIIGRAVVFHNLTDNCVTETSSSTRLARGVIGVGNPAYITTALGLTVTAPNTAFNTGAKTGNGVCYLMPNIGYNVTGTVYFNIDANSNVQVTASISGLALGTAHGIHIHEFGDISTQDGNSVGGHYNPYNMNHGVPPAAIRHLGDLGSVCAYDSAGVAFYSYANAIAGYNATYNYIGRAVVIHGSPDTNTTTYGPRIAQCVIGAANTATVAPTSTVASAPPSCGIPVNSTTTASPTTTTTTTTATTTTASATTSAITSATTSTGASSTTNSPVTSTSSAAGVCAMWVVTIFGMLSALIM